MPRTARWRTLLRWTAIVVPAVLLVGGVSVVASALAITQDLEDRLVDQSTALIEADYARPTHVDNPIAGEFSGHVQDLSYELEETMSIWLDRTDAPLFKICWAVREGIWPASDLPQRCRDIVENAREAVANLLRATHSQRGGAPPGIRRFTHPATRNQVGLFMLVRAAKVAALDARLAIDERGDIPTAASLCVDVLGLSRDTKLASGMQPWIAAETIVNLMYYSCVDALDQSELEAKKAMLLQIETIRAALPAFSTAVQTDAIYRELITFGPLMEASAFSRLDPVARAIVQAQPAADLIPRGAGTRMHSVFVALFERKPWSDYVGVMKEVEQLVDGSVAEAYLLIPQRTKSHEIDPLARTAASAPWHKYVQRQHAGQARFDLLVFAAAVDIYRAEHQKWPAEADIQSFEPLAPDAQIHYAVEGDVARLTAELVLSPYSDDNPYLQIVLHPG